MSKKNPQSLGTAEATVAIKIIPVIDASVFRQLADVLESLDLTDVDALPDVIRLHDSSDDWDEADQ